MSLVLIGYRGCGKTTVGRKLADRLWQPFADTDEIVMKTAGKPIRDIFAQDGEAGFRELELAAVREVAQLQEHVIAVGGGALERGENRDALKAGGHKLIYLRCEPAELHRRIAADPASADTRPDLTPGGGPEEIVTVLAQREPTYRAAAGAELDVTRLSPDEVCVYLARMI